MREFLSQFAGRAIGTPPKGSIHDVIANELLREHGVGNVTVRNYPWADFLPDAILDGEIAAAAGTPALAVTARRYGNARLAVPPDCLWPYNPSYGIVVRRRMLNDPEPLMRFLSAHEAACEMIRHEPAEAAGIVSGTTGMAEPGFVLETYRVSPKYCASLPPEYVQSTLRFVRTLQALGYISRPIRVDEIFERSLIDSVHPGPHHYDSGFSDPTD
jgi:NitT/TauT family transport system substrate-binding protein